KVMKGKRFIIALMAILMLICVAFLAGALQYTDESTKKMSEEEKSSEDTIEPADTTCCAADIAATSKKQSGPFVFFQYNPKTGEDFRYDLGHVVAEIKEKGIDNTSFDSLTEYSFDEFNWKVWQKPSSFINFVARTSYHLWNLDSFNRCFPIEKLSVINDDCIVAEYKLRKEENIFHAFVVFERIIIKDEKGINYENWGYSCETYFAYPSITIEDVSEINVSDKICTKDEMPFFVSPNHNLDIESLPDEYRHFEDTAMLKDGILIIEYDLLEDGVIEITSKTFIPYGEKNDSYPYNALIRNAFDPKF
ncbi:MAG: hypothetical protein KBT31_05715, partial [Firmicutes bacterium]|nr:hypothetical protein [Candidatus Colimorpha enterica]